MLRPGHVVQLAVIGLLSLAVVMVHSAAMSVGSAFADPLAILTSRHTLYAGLAVLAMLLASKVNIRHALQVRGWINPVWWILGAGLLLTVLAMVPGVGLNINGANRWLRLGAITFQPSEIVKWAMVLALALWCTRRQGAMGRFFVGLLPMLALMGLASATIVVEDLGTAALIGSVATFMLLAGGARLWQLLLLVPPAAGAVVLAIAHSPYRLARLTAFMDPWADPRGTGYHAIQSMLAITQGGLFGRGLGNGIQKFGYVPADTTDFIFAVICEELGLAGALLVVFAYVLLLGAGLAVLRQCRDAFGRLVALGVLLTVGLQAVMNLAVVTVLVPTKGIALPLLSAGGTGWIMTAFALGLVASLDEANRLDEAAEEPGDSTEDSGVRSQEPGAQLV